MIDYLFCAIGLQDRYDSKYEVEEEIRITNDAIQRIQSYMQSLAVMTDITLLEIEGDEERTDGMDIVEIIHGRMENKFRELQGLYDDKFRLEYLLDNWEKCHDAEGKAIPSPDDVYDKAYLDLDD